MQEWDYYLGIAAVKRMQGLFQSTLVAQGAFSLYRTDHIRAAGGWNDAIGEDIVLTWLLMSDGSRVYYELTAVAFTEVPTTLRHFMRQRARWSRGMFEGISALPPWRQKRVMSKFTAGLDLVIPLLDIGYVFLWLPGFLLFLVLQDPLFVSAWTLLVFPGTVLVYGGLRRFQVNHTFKPLDLRVRRNRLGYIVFLIGYQVFSSTAAIAGYVQYLLKLDRKWK